MKAGVKSIGLTEIGPRCELRLYQVLISLHKMKFIDGYYWNLRW